MLHFQLPKLNIVSRDGRCGTVCGHPRDPFESPKWILRYITGFNGLGLDDFFIVLKKCYLLSKLNDFYSLDFETEK